MYKSCVYMFFGFINEINGMLRTSTERGTKTVMDTRIKEGACHDSFTLFNKIFELNYLQGFGVLFI
jgi:hypothetical protein